MQTKSTSVLDFKDVNEVTVLGLSRNKQFLTVGGRKEHRVVKINKDGENNYSSIETITRVMTRNRSSLEYGIHDVKWNPSKYPPVIECRSCK